MPHRPALHSMSGDRMHDWGDSQGYDLSDTVRQIVSNNPSKRITASQARALAISYEVPIEVIYDAAEGRRAREASERDFARQNEQLRQERKKEKTYKLTTDKKGRTYARDIKTGRFVKVD